MDPSLQPLRTYLQQSGPPWLRWGARMLDGLLIVLVVESLPLDASDFLSSDVTLVTRRVLPAILLIPLEALLVSTFAVTPGKCYSASALFGKTGVGSAPANLFDGAFRSSSWAWVPGC